MKTRILSVLLLTAAFPLAAAAQSTTTSPGGATSTQQTAPAVTPAAPADSSNSTMGSGSSTDSGAAMNSGAAPSSTQTAAASMSGETFVTLPETGAWRVSDLQGKTVYASDGANIGEINDVLVSQDGSVNAVIIGVGGFLGIGEKDVAVNISALQLGPGDTQAQADAASKALPNNNGSTTDTTGATGATGAAGTTGMDATGTAAMGTSGAAGTGAAGTTGDMAANNTSSNGAKIGDDGLPDRIILNVTRDQLEKAPAFKGVGAEQNK